MICFLDMEGFVQKDEEKRSERQRGAVQTWLYELGSFMNREVTKEEWFRVFNRLLEGIFRRLQEQLGKAKDGDSTMLCEAFRQREIELAAREVGA